MSPGGRDQVNLEHFKTFYWGPTFISSDIDNEIMQGRVSANLITSVRLANKVQGDFLLTRSVKFVVCEKMLLFVVQWSRGERVTSWHVWVPGS